MTIHNNEYPISEALRLLLEEDGIENAVNEQKVKEAWYNTVGKYGKNYTKNIKFSKGILTVTISSDAFKQELLYAKSEIIDKINEKIKKKIITSIQIR